jgi:hypothetical protein
MRPKIIIAIPMPGLRPSLLALAATASCLLSGCSHTHVVSAGRTLHLALSEYRINPADVRVSSGIVTIFVRNYGRLTHNLVISQNGQNVASTPPVPPGDTAEMILDFAPGKYSMASTILSDQALGQYGTLVATG